MDSGLRNNLIKLFYASSERLGDAVQTKRPTKVRRKYKLLAFTISFEKPATVQLYTVKSPDKRELHKKLLTKCHALKTVDCHDVPDQPSYEMEFKTESQSWRLSAVRLEDKKRFISLFCMAVAAHQPQTFREIMWKNLPEGIDLSSTTVENLEKAIGEYWGDAMDPEDVKVETSSDLKLTDGYHTLTSREEADLRFFLDEMVQNQCGLDAEVLMDSLRRDLENAEGRNVHFIMESENQVSRLLKSLDNVLEDLDIVEAKLESYHQCIADVEESMSALHDRDQLAKTTGDNRRLLLDTLQRLVSKLSLNAGVLKTLDEVDLVSAGGIKRCKLAASSLDALLASEKIPGEEYLQAVSEKSVEVVSLRDKFARNLAIQINGMILRFCDQLLRIAPVYINSNEPSSRNISKHFGGSVANLSSSKSTISSSVTNIGNYSSSVAHCLDLQSVERSEMLLLSSIVGGWLQSNRPSVFHDLKQVYISKMKIFIGRIVHDMIQNSAQVINGLTRPCKQDAVSKQDYDSGSVMSLTPGNISIQFKTIFERTMAQLSSFVCGEEQFISEFFNLDNSTDELNKFACMQLLFEILPSEITELMVLCERQGPVFSMSMLLILLNLQANESKLLQKSPETGPHASIGRVGASFWSQVLTRCVTEARCGLKRHVDNLIKLFRETRQSKKSRCGLLNMVKQYEVFAESSISVFGNSVAMGELEKTHGDLIFSLMSELDRVAEESVKTPSAVILLENYHRIYDILCRLKIACLEETRKEAKLRYQRALHEYSLNCMGRPLENLHNFFEHVQGALDSGISPEAISYQFAFQKHELQKIIKEYPGKEVKRGLENLRKKVEKNLSEESNLFPVVWRSIQSEVTRQCVFYEKLIKQCYADSGLSLEFSLDDIQNFFSEIANAPKRHMLGDLHV